jgi:GT2 family glycosyltransferase
VTSPRDRRTSVIIPAFESHATVRATLESLRAQTTRDFETILIDSSRSDGVARVAADFPEVRFHRSGQRLLPHEARNVGIQMAGRDLLVFTDPDIVAAPDWLEKLVAASRTVDGPVAGAVASLQRDWLNLGIHLAKFDLWLPGGEMRIVPVAASVNFVCPRLLLEKVGCFNGQEMIGDTLLSWDLIELGHKLRLAPDAIVYHDHRSSWVGLLRERFVRGADFARLRVERANWSSLRRFVLLLATILPVRLIKLTMRSLRGAARGGCFLDALKTLPVIVSGHAAWLAGETMSYCRQLHLSTTRAETKPACTS